MSDLLRDIADAADTLTEPMRQVERIHELVAGRRRIRRILITHPSLLHQLAAAVVPGEVYVEDANGTHHAPRSTPPAQLDAIDRLLAIEAGAARWCALNRLSLRDDVTRNIRALVGAAPVMDSDRQTNLLADLHRWYGWAATVTGWLTPPWQPTAPCPLCEQRALRVRLDRSTGCCLDCGEAWTPDTIGLLADYVRAYDARARADAMAARLRARATRDMPA